MLKQAAQGARTPCRPSLPAAGRLARGRQARRPEVIKAQLVPQLAGEPAGAPLPRAVQAQAAEADLDDVALQRRRRAVFGKQRDLPAAVAALLERLDRAAPGGLLGVVDLAEVEHVSLHRAPAKDPAVLDNGPVAVLLAVLAAQLVAQEHGGSVSKPAGISQEGRSAPHPGPARWAMAFQHSIAAAAG